MVLDILLEGKEDPAHQIHALEYYAVLREYLFLETILNHLEDEMSEKARYILRSLRDHLRNELNYHAGEGGLKEAVMLETELITWRRLVRERQGGEVKEESTA